MHRPRLIWWLALLFIRIIDNSTSDTWRNLLHELDGMDLVTLATPHDQVAQRSQTTPANAPSWPPSTCPTRSSSSTSPSRRPPAPRLPAPPVVIRPCPTPPTSAQLRIRIQANVCSPSAEVRSEGLPRGFWEAGSEGLGEPVA